MYGAGPRWAVEACFEKLGVPVKTLRNISEILNGRVCRFKTAHGVTEPFAPQAGVPAGCPFACLCSRPSSSGYSSCFTSSAPDWRKTRSAACTRSSGHFKATPM